jgi:hypothetical protein
MSSPSKTKRVARSLRSLCLSILDSLFLVDLKLGTTTTFRANLPAKLKKAMETLKESRGVVTAAARVSEDMLQELAMAGRARGEGAHPRVAAIHQSSARGLTMKVFSCRFRWLESSLLCFVDWAD